MKIRIEFKPNEVPEDMVRACTIKDVSVVNYFEDKVRVYTNGMDYPRVFRIAEIARLEVQA